MSRWTGVVKWYNKHCPQDPDSFCIELLLFEAVHFLNKWLPHYVIEIHVEKGHDCLLANCTHCVVI